MLEETEDAGDDENDDDDEDEERDLEKGKDEAENAVPDNFWDEFDLEGEDLDDFDEDDFDDYFEEGEEEDSFDEDEEVEMTGTRIDKTDQADNDSVSTVSNEADLNYDEFDPPDLERSTAQIYPEPPWKKSGERVTKLLLSCLLPFLLVGLAIYSVFKGIKAVLKVLVDIYMLIRYLVFLCIRIALFPLYLLWKLCLPSWLQVFIWEKFDERIGRRLRVVLDLKSKAEAMVLDIPDVLWACTVAGFETCVVPCYKGLRYLCWMCCGRYILRYFLDPVFNTSINNAVEQRRRWAQGREDADPATASQALIAAKRLKKTKLKARRQRAQTMRHRRKVAQNQISLQLGVGDKRSDAHHMVQVQDYDRSKSKSRVMVIERSYAIAVGFGWCMSGLAVFIITLDGAKGEKCTICDEMPELGVRMCRHGEGQDCAFVYHMLEVVISVVLISVGLMILIYAVFLYQPKGLVEKAVAEEEEQKRIYEEEKYAKLKKQEDSDSQVLRLLEEKLYEVTFPKRVKNLYYWSCLGDIQHHVDNFGRSMLHRALKFESRHKLRQKSIAIQDGLIFMAWGWAEWMRKKLARCSGRRRSQERPTGRASQWLKQSAAGQSLSSIGNIIGDTFLVRAFIYFTGIGASQAITGEKEHVKTKVVGSGKRTAGSGALKVDDVIQRFGLYKSIDETEIAFTSLVDSTKNRKDIEEVVVDAGTDPVDEDVFEEPPELQDDEKFMHPGTEKEADDDQPEVHIG